MATDAGPPRASGDGALASIAIAGYGGMHATILSAVALVISAFSLYESTFKTAALEVYVPPVIHYARDGDGSLEVFAVPITVTNGGARKALPAPATSRPRRAGAQQEGIRATQGGRLRLVTILL